MPRRFSKLDLAGYNGTTDPKVFLCNFKYTMVNRKCTSSRSSQSTCGETLRIGSMSYLKTTSSPSTSWPHHSLIDFSKNCRVPNASVDILNVKQRKDESFTNYVMHFTMDILRLKCIVNEMICLAFKYRLLVVQLYTDASWYPPATTKDTWKFI